MGAGKMNPPIEPMTPSILPAWPGTYGIQLLPEPLLVPVLGFTVGWVVRNSGEKVAKPDSNVVDLFAKKKQQGANNNCPGYAKPATEGMGVTGAITQAGVDAVFAAFYYPDGHVLYGGRVMSMQDFLAEADLPANTFDNGDAEDEGSE